MSEPDLNPASTNTLFPTRNIAVASTLLAMGYRLRRIDTQGTLKIFVFDNEIGLEEAVEDFWQNRLLVEPQALLTANLNIRVQMRER